MALSNPTLSDFKTFFARDFPFGTDPSTSVVDQDILNAFIQTNGTINPGLFGGQSMYSPAYLQLTAHFLVLSLRASAQGIGGAFQFLESGRSVGSVSQSFAIPQSIQNNPYFAALLRTTYGGNYLMALLPSLTGQVYCVGGTTQP